MGQSDSRDSRSDQRLRRPSRRVVAVGLASLCVVAGTFVGGALTGRTLAASGTGQESEGSRSAPGDPARAQRLFVYGDSLVVQSEPYLAAVAGAFGLEVTVHAVGGIAPCDALKWLADDLRLSRPTIVVFAFTGNSLSDCMRAPSGELLTGTGLVDKYRLDTEFAITIATRSGVPFVVASPPASEYRADAWQQLDLVYRDIAAAHQPQVQYTDAGTQIAPDGRYAPTQRCLPFELTLSQSEAVCSSESGSIGVRAADGVHFCSDLSTPEAAASLCSDYSSGALRYAIALVTAAKLQLEFLDTLSTLADAPTPP